MTHDYNDSYVKVPVTVSREKHLTPARRFQGIPGVEVTRKGCLWAAWYSGGETEGPDNFVVVVKSDDQGKTWTDAMFVVDPPGENVRAFDPCLWLDPIGRLWLFWAQSYSPKDLTISDGVNGVWGAWTANPDADLPEWSEPVRLADGIMMNKPTVLSDGAWAVPAAVWADGIGGGKTPERIRNICGANLVVSCDQGGTFVYRGGVAVPERCCDEHMFVELKDGRLWCLVRTDYGVGQSFSADGGKTWTPGEDSNLRGPNSRFFIRRLQSGNLLLVNHDSPARKEGESNWRRRDKLTAWISLDDGGSWVGGLLLDARDGVSYPDGVQERNGDIWIIYDHQRYEQGDILLARFTEADAMAGKDVSGRVELRMPINHSGGVKK